MKRSTVSLGFLVAVAGLVGGERVAAACGGCFHPPTQTASDITDERMLLSVSTAQTTLYDQIRYAGSPTSFAWVLPIHGTVDVGLSADVLFDSVDTLTATRIVSPPSSCPPPPPSCVSNSGGGASFAADAGAAPGAEDKVTVTKQQNVGPFATVQLHATDAGALDKWLADNGFHIPADVTPVIDQYVKEGFDFLAMKLLPNQGVQAMRPVRVTSPGASLSLPLRMAAVGTGATVGITLWVVGDGRYEPQNFPGFHIEDKDLVWDWKTSLSNYTTLRVQNAAKFGGKGWEVESSLGLAESLVTSVILNGGRYYGGGFAPNQPSNAAEDYLPIGPAAVPPTDAGTGGGTATGDAGSAAAQSAAQVRDADIKALFAGMAGPVVRVTRMRSDISHAAMTKDFVLQASADQTELSNVRIVKTGVNEQCPIYQDCDVTGYGSPDASAASVAATESSAAHGISGSSGGCLVAGSEGGTSTLGLGAFAGGLGLVVARMFRNARRQRSSRR